MQNKTTQRMMACFMSSLLLVNQLFFPCSAVFAETLNKNSSEPVIETKDTSSDDLVEAPKDDDRAVDSVDDDLPSKNDTNTIEDFSMRWRGDNNDHAHFSWDTNDPQVVSFVINYSLSGEKPYDKGAIRIKLPKKAIANRFGDNVGRVTFGVPKAPDNSALFSYTETEDNYIISNTKKISVATSGFIEVSIRDLTPSDIKDKATGYKTDEYMATLNVSTQDGTIGYQSEPLTADFDTTGKIYGAYIRHNSIMDDQFPSSWDSSLKPSNPDNYYYATFTAYAYSKANQYYNVDLDVNARNSSDASNAIVLGVKNNRTGEVIKGNQEGEFSAQIEKNSYQSDGQNFLSTIYVAYPKSSFPANRSYNLDTKATFKMMTVDDKTTTSASENASLPFAPIHTDITTGSFYADILGEPGNSYEWPDMYHKEGIYDIALNKLSTGNSFDTKFRVETRSHAGTYTLRKDGNPRNINDYGQRSFKQITVVNNPVFNSTQNLSSNDFQFKSLDFSRQLQGFCFTELDDDERVYNNIVGSDFSTTTDTKPLFGYKQVNNSDLPPVDVFVQRNDSNNWEKIATVDYSSGSAVIDAIQGDVQGTQLFLPENTTAIKFESDTKLTGYVQDVYVTTTVKPSEKIKNCIASLYRDTIIPMSYLSLSTNLHIDQDGYSGFVDEYTGRNQLHGFASGTQTENKIVTYENDVKHQNVNLTYEISNTLQTNVNQKSTLENVINDGLMNERSEGTFYSLLPEGVSPVTKSVRAVRSGDSVESVDTIENYKNTGRTLLKVKLHQTPDYKYQYRDNGGLLKATGYYDKAAVRFEARYSWINLHSYGKTLRNIAAYDSDVKCGTVKGLMTENNVYSNLNKFTDLAFNNDEEKKPFEDLTGNLTFACVDKAIVVDTSGVTNLYKQVDVNNESLWGDGQDEGLAKNVYAGGRYSYAVTVQNPESSSSRDNIFFDKIEGYKPISGDPDARDEQWKGTLEKVDITGAKVSGVAPKVYYSTKKDIQFSDENRSNMDVSNKNIWTDEMPEDKSSITAVAVDCRYTEDGSDFVLPEKGQLSFKLLMRAPKDVQDWQFDSELKEGEKEEGKTGGAHAYNSVCMLTRSISHSGTSDINFVHNEYTKVGLKPYHIRATKSWDDDDNRDGLRKDSAVLELVANGTPTGNKITVNKDNNWTADFGNVSYVDDDGQPIVYSIKEDELEGYDLRVTKRTEEKDGITYFLSNHHDPERISIQGEKKWIDNNNTGKHPKSVRISLKADGFEVKSIDVKPEPDGTWKYAFNDLYKYRDGGQKINYEVYEKDYITGYASKVEGWNIINTYDPYTDVTIKKEVTNATPNAKNLNPDFTFKLMINDLNNKVVNETYNFSTTKGRTGQLSVGQEFTLKDGEVMTLKHVPSERIVNLEEVKIPKGYSLTRIDGNGVKLQAGKVVNLVAKNDYKDKGRVEIAMQKNLTGRKTKPFEFQYELLEDNKVVATAVNDESNKITFYVNYSNEQVGTTHNYTVREINTKQGGVIFDQREYPVSVDVSDDGQGNIVTKVTGDKKAFNNVYHAKGSVDLKSWKIISDGTKPEKDQFTFQLLAGDKVLQEVKNDENGVIDFHLDFTEKDVEKTFMYKVKEVQGNNKDLDYDNHEVQYIVKVHDRGDGTLNFETKATDLYTDDYKNDSATPIFYNHMKDGSLTISKKVQDGDPKETFTFKVKLSGKDVKDGDYKIERGEIKEEDDVDPNRNILHEGVSGSVKWSFDDKGVLFFEPVNGNEGTFADSNGFVGLGDPNNGYDWTWLGIDIKQIESRGNINLASDSSYMFSGCSSLTSVAGLENWNTGNVTNMSDMFSGCSSLTSLAGLENWNTGNVTKMYNMFQGCSGLTSLAGLENWNTGNVTDMSDMFQGCSGLTSLAGLENWNTGNVTDMSDMFKGCVALANLNALKNWNMQMGVFTDKIFIDCTSLATVGLSNTNKNIISHLPTGETSTLSSKWHKVGTTKEYTLSELKQNWNSSFEGIWSREKINNSSYFTSFMTLPTLDNSLSSSNTNNNPTPIENLSSAATDPTATEKNNSTVTEENNFEKLQKKVFEETYNSNPLLNLFSSYNSNNNSDRSYRNILHEGVSGSVKWSLDDEGVLFFEPVSGNEGTFANSRGYLIAPDFSTSHNSGYDWNNYYQSIKQIKSRGIINLAEDSNFMFQGCSGLTSLAGLENWNTGNVTDMSDMFSGCSSLTSLSGLENWNTDNVTNMYNMFQGCSGLTSLAGLENWNTGNVTDMSDMFQGCSSLATVGLSDTNKNIISYLPTNDTSTLSSKYHKVGTTKEYTLSELQRSWNSSFEGIWSREKSQNYTIHFNTNGTGEELKDITAKKGKVVSLPIPSSHLPGKYFLGWSKSPNGEVLTSHKNITEPGQEITLYAIWKDLDSTVNIHNGEFTVAVPAGETVTIKNLPSKTSYQVQELTKAGWVTVKQENATGIISANKESKANFLNHYDPTKTNASIIATKLLDNKPASGFTFDLYKDGSKIDSATSLNDGTVTFNSLVLDRPGTYTYQIKESNTTNPKYTYDTSTKTITVNVKDIDGVLSAQVNDNNPTFTNTTNKGTLTVQKHVNNNYHPDQLFTFSLITDNTTQTFQLHANEKKSFSLPYGTKYELQEINIPKGYTQDSFTNQSGTIDQNSPSITAVATNTLGLYGTVQLKAKKVLKNKKLQAGEFSFELKDKKTKMVLSHATNDENGDITFDLQEYTKPGVYYYDISEVVPQDTNSTISYDRSSKRVKVTVTDTNNGKLSAVANRVPVFTNTYTPNNGASHFTKVPEYVSITKTVKGTQTDQPFNIKIDVIAPERGAISSITKDTVYKLTSNKQETRWIHSGDTVQIHQDEVLNIGVAPSYSVKVSEERTKNFHLDHSSKLTADTAKHENTISLVNVYDANGQIELTGKKTLTGGNVNNYHFKFLVLSEDDDVVTTGTSTGEQITFDPIYYTQKDIGKTFTYKVVEDTGTNKEINYDKSEKTIKVTVKDKGSGVLEPTVTDDSDTIEFHNSVKPILPTTGTAGIAMAVLFLLGGTVVAIKKRK